ncbi:pyridoxal phosphate-dependent transferase [Naematelia encephala]|uniref:Pyridoxal phosphate-dependent transferase n=1 Tax=Naematelia encephala TaxID=71784 RepID=A0A1Y2B2P3_9TREE|nr:pyridoxal phosphate-dependent transferase [Naematelia encephala]
MHCSSTISILRSSTTTTLKTRFTAFPYISTRSHQRYIHSCRRFATIPTNTNTMPVPQPKADITAEVSGQENADRLFSISRDFRSDTITIPTDGQLLAALRASRGDDVYKEDATTTELEARVARLTGKEAAMFAVSGTMTNQLAIRTHMKQPPHSVITDYRAHVHKMEAGGIAMFSQATTHQLVPKNGRHLTVEDIEPALQLGDNIHIAPTRLISLENTLSGTILPQSDILEIAALAKKHDILLHLDGARIWNVAAVDIEQKRLDPHNEQDLQTVLTDLLAPFDTASLCLSKGLGAPIGSMLVGTKAFIDRARWFRKAFGGGIRQSGSITAMADYALTHHFPRLAGTHALAKRLAKGLEDAGCTILADVDTNMVFFDPTSAGLSMDSVVSALGSLQPVPITFMRERLVVHHQTSQHAVDEFVDTVQQLAQKANQGKTLKEKQQGESDVAEADLRKKAVLGY